MLRNFFVLFGLLAMLVALPAMGQSEEEIQKMLQAMRDAGMDAAQIEQAEAGLRAAAALGSQIDIPPQPPEQAEKPQAAAAEPQIKPPPSAIAATPAQPVPGQLIVHLGDQRLAFELGRCLTEPYRTGNLIVEAEVTATGTFNGEPVAIFMQRSHPAPEMGGNQLFQHLDLWLVELSDEQKNQSQFEIDAAIQKEFSEWYGAELQAVQERYKIEDSMPADEKFAAMEQQMQASDALQDEADLRQVAKLRSHGSVVVEGGGQIRHTSDRALRYVNSPVPAPFAGLNHEVSAVAACR